MVDVVGSKTTAPSVKNQPKSPPRMEGAFQGPSLRVPGKIGILQRERSCVQPWNAQFPIIASIDTMESIVQSPSQAAEIAVCNALVKARDDGLAYIRPVVAVGIG